MADAAWGDVYKELGAKPIISAIGSVTMLGAKQAPNMTKFLSGGGIGVPAAHLDRPRPHRPIAQIGDGA